MVGDIIIATPDTLAAYDLATGEPRWFCPKSGGYSLPHLMTIDIAAFRLSLQGRWRGLPSRPS